MDDQTKEKANLNPSPRKAFSPEGAAGTGKGSETEDSFVKPPVLSLPKGGGAIQGIGEKFEVNAANGTASFSVPIALSPSRSGFGPQLSLSYNSGSGNGPFGLGWSLSVPSIARKTEKGLPRYRDSEDSDIFILAGAEDLVPDYQYDPGQEIWKRDSQTIPLSGISYTVQRYRPRVEGLFARIERWTNQATGDAYWQSVTKDNVTSVYGKDPSSRVFDPADNRRVFKWLLSESYDDKGNWIVYGYAPEDSDNIDASQANEANRTPAGRSANRYLQSILYGNQVSHLTQTDSAQAQWMFQV
ncbi:MAG TPA: SpvB/TcaC N-terminal domain-containing protein, partial [bacterium]|nr:SpvB/TcaC N-terminal domain-containing protein [bacterium]